MTTTPVLAFPDIHKDFILDTDASFSTIGGVLSQKDTNGRERLIAYGSHAMNAHEKGYCVTRKEFLAIYFFCNHFQHYLYGKKFLLRTDHKAITFMLNTKKPLTPQFQTWITYLSSLDMEIQYRSGDRHQNADMLSRLVCDTCVQCQLQHEDAKRDKIKTKTLNVVNVTDEYHWQKNNADIDKLKQEIGKGLCVDFVQHGGVIKRPNGKTWIPRVNRYTFVKAIHELLAHAGCEKTQRYVESGYDMDSLSDTVAKVTRSCEACQKNKVFTSRTKEPVVAIPVGQRFEKIYIDICGPLKETLLRKKYIFAIIDQCSRYISLTAIHKQDEETIKEVIMEKWILRFGAPREIHVDCGKCFKSRSFKILADSMGIKLCFSSPYHHNTNGVVERQFRTIRDCLNAESSDTNSISWDKKLPEIEFMLNATYQKSIEMSPASMIYGREIRRERWLDSPQMENKQAIQFPTKRSFQLGDLVLIKAEVRTKDKERYEGPFTIVAKIHDRRYVLKDQRGRKIERNVEKIKKFLEEGGCENI